MQLITYVTYNIRWKSKETQNCSLCIIKNACGSFVILNRNRGPDPFRVAESDFESEMILFTLEEEEKWLFDFSRQQNWVSKLVRNQQSFHPMRFCNLTSTFYTTFMVPRKYRTSPKNTFSFFIQTKDSFLVKMQIYFFQFQSSWREPRLVSVNRSWFESIYSMEKI